MANFLAPIINEQMVDNNGAPLSGGSVEVYLAGTSTPATTYSDKAGLVPNTWPVILNTLGVNNQGAVWLTGGAAYKFVIKNSVGVVQRTIDNVSGINDSTVSVDQWIVYQSAPTFVSATSFTVAGDQTQTFQVGRRVRTQNTGGLVYSTITASVFGSPNTTVTVRNDSGVLDSGLSQVSYGIISAQNSSVTGLLINTRTITATGTYTPTPGTTFILVEGIGGGGAGGGVPVSGGGTASCGGGGAAGTWGRKRINNPASSVSVTVGLGGVGIAGGTGASGGQSSFGALLILPGGGGGVLGVSGAAIGISGIPGTPGAAATGDDISFTGQQGGTGVNLSATLNVSGYGGSTPLGAGGGSVGGSGTSVTNGLIARGYGAGGSGAIGISNGVTGAGGNGAPGIFIVSEYV